MLAAAGVALDAVIVSVEIVGGLITLIVVASELVDICRGLLHKLGKK